MKDKLVAQIMKKFVESRAKTHIYLKSSNDENKKKKNAQKLVP